jgi:Domain of unknown function (DUF4159)
MDVPAVTGVGMTLGHLRMGLGLAVLVTVFGIASPFAQRGYRQSYSGNVRYDGKFVFVRLSYPWGYGRGAPWAHDWPRGETHFLKIFSELTSVQAHVTESSIMSLSDPDLFKFPVAYMAEPGYWSMGDDEVRNLRDYLLKGGFLILDDFRNREWANVDLQFSRMFPQGQWVDLDASHPIFSSFFEINSLDIIPQAYDAGRPMFRGMYEDNDPSKRMFVVAAYNTDMSEFWEWSDTGYAPMEVNNEAYKIGINLFMYGLMH